MVLNATLTIAGPEGGKEKVNIITYNGEKIVASGDIYENPGVNFNSGRVSIGDHSNWLYFKSLHPEPADLHHRIVELLRTVDV